MANRRLLSRVLEEMRSNPRQLEAVEEKGHCVVLAGPGSGKTKTLTAAMARCLLDDVSEPRGVACITYNNECAIELESRLRKLGVEPGDQVFVGTVHGFALTHLLIPYARCVWPKFPQTLRIATPTQKRAAVEKAYSQVFDRRGDPHAEWRKAEIKRRQDVDRKHPMWRGRSPDLARFIEAYEANLHREGMIDFDDMPLLAVRMASEHEWIRRSIWAKFPVLFVDEYQDLGYALHELVMLLCFKAGSRLFAVGDPDQSIYRFTGANPKLLQDLSSRFDVKTIELPINYRSATNIIEASKAALGEERIYQAPEGTAPGTIFFHPVEGGAAEEAEFVIGELVPRISEYTSVEEIAVLYRNADQGSELAARASSARIPVVRSDAQALVPRNMRLSRFAELCASWVTGGWKSGDPPFRRILREAVGLVYGGYSSRDEQDKIEGEVAYFLHSTLNESGSTHSWLVKFRDALVEPWQQRARTITEDWSIIDTMIARTDPLTGNEDLPLTHFAGRIGQQGRLNLSTLHSAKGREFDSVIIFGMDRDSLPGPRDRGDEEFREARRLFYVGVTRARKELHLVFKRKRWSPWVGELYRRLHRAGADVSVTQPADLQRDLD